MRHCSNCFTFKPESEFYTRRQKLTRGRINLTYQARCKACNAEVVRAYHKRKREKELKARWDKLYGRTP